MKERAIQEGVTFENKIKELINKTSLRHYTFHQLKINTGLTYIIPDHIIFLPHKVVIIEDKLRNAEDIKIFNKYDAIQVKGFKSNKVFDSIVQQVTLYKQVLTDIFKQAEKDFSLPLKQPFDLYLSGKGSTSVSEVVLNDITFRIEGLCCIESQGATVTSYQTKVPLISLEGFQNYLKVLENELTFYDKTLVDWTFDNRSALLFKFVEQKRGKPFEVDNLFNY